MIIKVKTYSAVELCVTAAITIITLSLAWWQIDSVVTNWVVVIVFMSTFIVMAYGLVVETNHRSLPVALLILPFLFAGVLLLGDLGSYSERSMVLVALVHHWGAFIGPALHVRAGLVPFYDIPLQYGLGPTSLIAATCNGADCWLGTEVMVVSASVLMSFLVVCMALMTLRPRSWPWQVAVTLAVFAAVYLWTGEPFYGNRVLAYPSSTGLRYLPVCAIAYLLFFNHPRWAAVLLVPAVLWSPESAVMALSVFGLSETARIGIVRAASRSLLIAAASYGTLIVLHRLTFGVWIEPATFFEYVLHVPGPLPINPVSDAMVLAATLLLGGWLLRHRSQDAVTAQRDRVVTFLLFATASVWFGRSHENNICNIMPFIVLVAVRAMDRGPTASSRLGDPVNFALAVSVAALALSPWRSVPFDPRATTDIYDIVKMIPLVDPDVRQIRHDLPNPGNLGIADFGRFYIRNPSERLVWTPMDPSSLWTFVPSARRQVYIQRSSMRLRRSGWAIFEADQNEMIKDFAAGYVVKSERYFDHGVSQPKISRTGYTVVCFDPRPDLVVNRVGPACPSGDSTRHQ